MHFQMFGIPVNINITTIFLIVVLVWYGYNYIKERSSFSSKYWKITLPVLTGILVLITVFFHELAHGLTAIKLGYEVTGSGINAFAAYVQIDTDGANALELVLINLAGPLVNLIAALLFAIPVWRMKESPLENAFQFLSWLSWRLFWMNMLPIAFLDGGRAYHSILAGLSDSENFADIVIVFPGWLFLMSVLTSHKNRRDGLNITLNRLRFLTSFERYLDRLGPKEITNLHTPN